jgi:hypothetical protein
MPCNHLKKLLVCLAYCALSPPTAHRIHCKIKQGYLESVIQSVCST